MKIEKFCDLIGKVNTMEIPTLTPERLDEVMKKWREGMLIQKAAPFLNADEREFLITGITPDLWDKMFKEPEE